MKYELGFEQIGGSCTFVVKEGYDPEEQVEIIRKCHPNDDVDVYEKNGKYYVIVSYNIK